MDLSSPVKAARIFLLVLLGASAPGPAQLYPIGTSFQVDDSSVERITSASVALSSNGTFAVGFSAIFGVDTSELYLRTFRFDDLQASPVTLATDPTYHGGKTPGGVGIDDQGRVVVSWGRFADFNRVFARQFTSEATPLGPAFIVSTLPEQDHQLPEVARAGSGEMAFVWAFTDKTVPIPGSQIALRWMDSSRGPLTAEKVITPNLGESNFTPAVAVDPTLASSVAWTRRAGPLFHNLFLRSLDAEGEPLGEETQVNLSGSLRSPWPTVARGSDGTTVVIWPTHDFDRSRQWIHARLFDSVGQPLTGEIQVNQQTEGLQMAPDVVFDAEGNFLVVWADVDDSPPTVGAIKARAFGPDGTPMTEDLLVASAEDGAASYPRIAIDPASGRTVIVWTVYREQPADNTLHAQRFLFGRAPAVQPIPTLGDFGLILLALSVLISGLIVHRRRRHAVGC